MHERTISHLRSANVMDMTLQNQGHMASDILVGHQPDPGDINQEDDFDFEIGGEDGFDRAGEADEQDGGLLDQFDATEDDKMDMGPSQEQTPHAAVAENYDGEGHEYGYSELGSDGLTEPTEIIQDVEDDLQNDLGAADQEARDENVETFSHEEVYYEETVRESEGLDNTVHPELIQDHDLMNTATSVDHVHEGDDLLERTQGADNSEPETGNTAVQDYQPVVETEKNGETAEGTGNEDQAHSANAPAEAKSSDITDDPAGETLIRIDANGEAVAESLDHSNWGENDDDDDDSNAIPIVTVSYRGQEYSMFAQSLEDDPDTYFLDGVDSVHRPLSQLLGNVREVISSELEAGHELFARIDGLGLEFGESTAKDFLDQTTLAQIIEVNDKLSQNDGGSQHAELYIFLSVRSNALQRFAELAKGAEEGQGLSYFEQYYEDSPADVSPFDDEEQNGITQDLGSDGLSQEEPFGESEQETNGADNFVNAEQGHNPFQSDEQQQPLNDATISEILAAETDAVDHAVDATSLETQVPDEEVNDSTDVAEEVDDNNFDITATDAQAILDADNAFGDAMSAVDRVETEMGQDWENDEEVETQDGLVAMDAGEVTEQTDVLIDNSEERHEGSDGENPFFLSTNDCLAPGYCVCNHCLDMEIEVLVVKADHRASVPTASIPASTDTRSFLLSEADWDSLMAESTKGKYTVADRQAQDPAANMANDEDYLDLGNDAEDPTPTTNNEAADQLDIQQHITPNSSATATLNGEENGQGDEAATNQDPADPSHRTPDQTTQNEDDEIDWNHEDDDDVGVADQNPTSLSPSSLSAKRSRQEDDGTDGLGEDLGMSSMRGAPRAEADSTPAAKRRRT